MYTHMANTTHDDWSSCLCAESIRCQIPKRFYLRAPPVITDYRPVRQQPRRHLKRVSNDRNKSSGIFTRRQTDLVKRARVFVNNNSKKKKISVLTSTRLCMPDLSSKRSVG